jgi:hypothetical protein
MRRLACAAALAAVAAELACGTTDDEKLMNARQGICAGGVGTTVADLSAKWGYGPDQSANCDPALSLRGSNNRCDASAPRCLVTWKEVFRTNGTECNPVGGCAYMCEAFTPQPATGPTIDPADLAAETICGTVFSAGQFPVLAP